MRNDYLTIAGQQYRVEANWDAFVSFCEIRGYDTLESIDMLKNIKMRDLAPLMWACIKEGEKQDGREFGLSLNEFSPLLMPIHITQFMPIYVKHTKQPDAPKAPAPEPTPQKKSKLKKLFSR